jgi:hypothetical protein
MRLILVAFLFLVICTAFAQDKRAEKIFKFSAVHLFEHTLKSGCELKTINQKHGFSLLALFTRLRDETDCQEWRRLTGYGLEFQYRFYTTKDNLFTIRKNWSIKNYLMGSGKINRYVDVYESTHTFYDNVAYYQKNLLTNADTGLSLGLQGRSKKLTLEFFAGLGYRVNKWTAFGRNDFRYMKYFHERAKIYAYPFLYYEGLFPKIGFEVGVVL